MLPMTMSERTLFRGLFDTLIRAAMVAALVAACYQVFRPFLSLVVWSVILAINFYPLQLMIKRRLGGKDGRAATVIVLLTFLILGVPIYMLGLSMTESAESALEWVKDGSFHIPPPAESVAAWPLVGEKLYGFWQQAATDLSGLAQKLAPQLKDVSLVMLGKLAGLGLGLMMFLVAVIIAGVIMAFGENGTRSTVQIADRVFGGHGQGEKVTRLCTATIRAVAQGVIGIAFIQMLLVGIGFVMMGIPGAGFLALMVLVLAIVQLPATLVTLPVIAFVFFTQGATLATIAFAVYIFVAGLVDNVLKPLLLGRGVDVPMAVVLIGSIGGMATSGILGLFIGPVVLAVGYQLFWRWVRNEAADSEKAAENAIASEASAI
jgi:predicted PurR-regulated permease PerM